MDSFFIKYIWNTGIDGLESYMWPLTLFKKNSIIPWIKNLVKCLFCVIHLSWEEHEWKDYRVI